MEYKLNFKKSYRDKRDFIYNSLNKIKLPEILDYRNELMPIRNQGSQGTCYAQSACCMKEWQEKKNYGFNNYFSPQFFYNNRPNKYDDDPTNDEGMFGRDVMAMLKEIGVCEEKDYPYGTVQNKKEIDPRLYYKSKKNIIKNYAKVNDINNLKLSLFNNGPCLVGMPVYNYSDQLWIKKKNNKLLGGHAMNIVGYNKEGFIIRNSWGKFWGSEGYSIYNYKDWGAHWEIWTTVDKNSIKEGEEIIVETDIVETNDDKNESSNIKCCIIC
jgi:C1A family cysteine protease